MAYVITSKCIEEKAGVCAQVCPVDAINSDSNQFYINPEICIDCCACESICPVDAIYFEDNIPKSEEEFIEINADFFKY